jgi:hypothetical protein
MLITWKSYTFDICHDGAHYLAICQRTGKPKTRHDRNVWYNANGTKVVNHDLLDTLELGVSDFQSLVAPRRFAPLGGSIRHTSPNSERPVRTAQKRFGREMKGRME